jgi:glycosyltransferase involved in cell wall biosynthesis
VRPDGLVAVNAAIVGERPTGLGAYALELVRCLDRLGERLLVFSSRPDLVDARHAVLRPAPAGARPERGARGHLRRLLWVQTGLRVALRRAPAVLLLNLTPEGILGSRLPQVTVLHDVLPLRFPAEYPRQQHYFRHYVPAVLRASRAVVVSSESTRRDVLELYGLPDARLHVVSPGVDVDRFAPASRPAASEGLPYALYVGNVMPHKNLLRLVDAFAANARGDGRRLLLRGWGRPPHVAALRARIGAAGIEAQVDWQPYALAEELPRLYQGARMLLLPSLREGFGLTALEAMASGTPVITSNASSLPEVVGDAGLLVDPQETGALARAIDRLFRDDALVGELRARGLRRARTFSWEKTGRAVRAIIDRVMDRSRADSEAWSARGRP